HEPYNRTWSLYEEGYEYSEVLASTASEALDIAIENVDRSNYGNDDDDDNNTMWIEVEARCKLTGEYESATVTLHPEEPECPKGEHEWESPFRIVGGIKENPGIWGNGGGIIIDQVCIHCYAGRTKNTWAQDPQTGVQGLTSVTYYPPGHWAPKDEAEA
ncbi:MAG: hypothetical protein HC877_23410, partial [Thioploca sp.]|nr:hypothetical protein [Thioploca sp.]